MCSIVNLFLVVHIAQQIAGNPTQNSRLEAPTRPEARFLRSEKETTKQARGYMEPEPDATPDELSQDTMKKDVVRIFQGITKVTEL